MAEEFHTSYSEFVDPKVITIKISDEIIAAIMPHFPKSAKVISAYLSADQLYWKVNYHWELLLWAIGKLMAVTPAGATLTTLTAMKTTLEADTPSPASGYRTSSTPGLPKDASSDAQILTRHATVTRVKSQLSALVKSAGLDKTWKGEPKALMLSYAAVASPLKGKHRTGYALDIKGNNAAIKRIAKSLGATMTFDEGSHVHCEWKNGVDQAGSAAANSVERAGRAAAVMIESGIINARHCLLWMDAA